MTPEELHKVISVIMLEKELDELMKIDTILLTQIKALKSKMPAQKKNGLGDFFGNKRY